MPGLKKNENSMSYFIDYNNNNIAEVIAFDENKDKIIDYFVVDTNLNEIPDSLIYPYKNKNNLGYIWFIDNDENGEVDKVGNDFDGDWKVEIISKI